MNDGTYSRRRVLAMGGAAAAGAAMGLAAMGSPPVAPPRQGLDYGWGRPSPSVLRAKGISFVCRYVSWDDTGKNLTRPRRRR